MAVREEERAAIARELHDELGQALTRLNIDISRLADKLPKKYRTDRVQDTLLFVDRMLDTIRNLCARLRPAILDDLGLDAAIEWEARQLTDRHDCRLEMDLDLSGLKADHDRDTMVFRIVQEALTNVARHAHARTVSITARTDKSEVEVTVADDGVGISDRQLSSARSLGLIGMRERAMSMGAFLDIKSRRPHGTVVTVRVPLPVGAKVEVS